MTLALYVYHLLLYKLYNVLHCPEKFKKILRYDRVPKDGQSCKLVSGRWRPQEMWSAQEHLSGDLWGRLTSCIGRLSTEMLRVINYISLFSIKKYIYCNKTPYKRCETPTLIFPFFLVRQQLGNKYLRINLLNLF